MQIHMHTCTRTHMHARIAHAGERLVELIESTPLDDASDIQIQSDFLPILREVLGRVPPAMADGERDAPALDLEEVADAERRQGQAMQVGSSKLKGTVNIILIIVLELCQYSIKS